MKKIIEYDTTSIEQAYLSEINPTKINHFQFLLMLILKKGAVFMKVLLIAIVAIVCALIAKNEKK